jgi:hypothetical protein
MILNEQRQSLSTHACLEVPNADRTILSLKEWHASFPKVTRYFNGYSIDRCVLTFYKKSNEKHEGNVLYVLQDSDSAEEMKEIFAENGYLLDVDEVDDGPRNALTPEEISLHKEHLEDIRKGLALQ